MARYVALLRGINVGGHRKLPMADLRAVCEEIGLGEARSYVASGNLVFDSAKDGDALEKDLEAAIERRFGFGVDVIVRSAAQWQLYCRANPFLEEAGRDPNLVMITLGKRPATDADVEALRARAAANERVERAGDAIWTWFGGGAGRSKIGTGPAKGVWTTRNWRTVLKLGEMLSA